jgi:hypothetical protein
LERPTGIEPVASAWEAEVLPLYEGRVACADLTCGKARALILAVEFAR